MAVVAEIDWGSPPYVASRELREEILRKPLGLTLAGEPEDGEMAWRHFAIFLEKQVVGCVLAIPESSLSARIRQMAVRENYQGRGLGRRLLLETEARLARSGFSEFVLSARMEAVPFYGKLGYHAVGEVFQSIGIPHQRMEKSLLRA